MSRITPSGSVRRPSMAVAPSSLVIQPKPVQQKPKPLSANNTRKYRDPRDSKGDPSEDTETYAQKRKTLIFTMVLGLVMIGVGGVLTWVGTSNGLRDFLIMGPGAIIIGTGMVITGLVVMGRDFCKMRKRSKIQEEEQEIKDIQERKLINEYDLPSEPIDPLKLPPRQPTVEDLYGGHSGGNALPSLVEESESKSGSKADLGGDAIDAEIQRVYGNKVKNLPAPMLAYPSHHGGGGEEASGDAVYTVPLKLKVEDVASNSQDNENTPKTVTRKDSKLKNSNNSANNKYPVYDLPGSMDGLNRQPTVTDLYGSPDATDFGSRPITDTPCTEKTDLDSSQEDIESSLKEQLKDHEPPDVSHPISTDL